MVSWGAYDGYTKTIEGTSVRTSGGAIVTLISVAFGALLFCTEFSQYLAVHMVETVDIDVTRGVESVDLNIDVVFLMVGCGEFRFLNEDSKGGAPDDVTDRLSLSAWPAKHPAGAPPGCRAKGVVAVPKASGRLRVALGDAEQAQREGKLAALLAVNGSHTIQALSFGRAAPRGHRVAPQRGAADSAEGSPLDGETRSVLEGAAQWQYYIKIVPTVYKPLRGANSMAFQYSVTEYVRKIQDPFSLFGFLGLAPQQLPSVTFIYEFSPIMVTLKETRRSFLQFLTSVCGVIGGVFTLASVSDRVLFKLTNAKRD